MVLASGRASFNPISVLLNFPCRLYNIMFVKITLRGGLDHAVSLWRTVCDNHYTTRPWCWVEQYIFRKTAKKRDNIGKMEIWMHIHTYANISHITCKLSSIAAKAHVTSSNSRDLLDSCICDVIILRIHGRVFVFSDTILRKLIDCIFNIYEAEILEAKSKRLWRHQREFSRPYIHVNWHEFTGLRDCIHSDCIVTAYSTITKFDF